MSYDIEHPEITWAQRTGYPSWMQENLDCDNDEDNSDNDEEDDYDE